MDNKSKNDILKLIKIENKILEIYRKIIKKEIINEKIEEEIKKLKELKKQEEFLSSLSYEELNTISDYIQKYDTTFSLITQRIINLVNKIIEEEYLEECLENEELEGIEEELIEELEEIDKETVEYIKKEDALIEYLFRDLILLRIKKLDEKIKKCNNDNIKSNLINYKYEYLFSEISVEEELIENNFNMDDLHLISKLAIEISEIDSYTIEELYKDIAQDEIQSINNLKNISNLLEDEELKRGDLEFFEQEILLNIAFLEAESQIFSITKEDIIKIFSTKKNINKKINEEFDEKKTKYLTLIRKK